MIDFALDLVMMNKVKNNTNNLSSIYDITGKNIKCINTDIATRFYEMIIFLKTNKLEPTQQNVSKLCSGFIRNYDPILKPLSSQDLDLFRNHIGYLKKSELMKVGMEYVGLLYMGYQLYVSVSKISKNKKLKFIPVILIVAIIVFQLIKTYKKNYIEQEFNIIDRLSETLNNINEDVYLNLPNINNIGKSSLFFEMLTAKKDIFINYVKQQEVKQEVKQEQIFANNPDAGIEMSKFEVIEKQLLPELFLTQISVDDESVKLDEKEPVQEQVQEEQHDIILMSDSKPEEVNEQSQEPVQEVAQEVAQEPVQEVAQEVAQEAVQEVAQEVEQEVEQEPAQEVEQEPAQEPVKKPVVYAKPKRTIKNKETKITKNKKTTKSKK